MNKYHRIRISKTKSQDEHRLIMEEKLGRKLSSDELVHHKNEDKADNEPDNLELTNRSEHAKYHAIGRIISLETREKLRQITLAHRQLYHKYTREQFIEVLQLHNKGYSYRSIVRIAGIPKSTVRDMIKGIRKCYRSYIAS